MRHKSSIKTDRMQRLYNLLKSGKIFFTAEIAKATKSVAPHSDVSDLRFAVKPMGLGIFCEYYGLNRNGRKVYMYKMVHK